jgi:putative peptide zinc metalloprotease protein
MPPELRSGIEILKSGPGTFLLLDAAGGESFELGSRERYVLQLLDGRRSVDEIALEYGTVSGAGAAAAREIRGFLEQLRVLGFLDPSTVPHRPDPEESAPPPVPLSRSDPGAALNTRFDLLAVLLGWLFHPGWAGAVVALALLACAAVIGNFHTFMRELGGVFQPPRLPLIVIGSVLQTILCLNLTREILVATAFRRFGGRLRRFGIGFYRHLVPYFQVDVGDSFLQIDERRRWTVLTAGLWVTLAIGSIASLGWWATSPESWLRRFWLVLVPPCVIGLATRLWPLLQYDGYLMLSVHLEIPFLWERAVAETRAFLGLSPSPEPLSDRERFWFRLYGLGILFWKYAAPTVIFGVVGWWLTNRFAGAGATVTILLLVWWFHEWTWRQAMEIDALRWLVRGGGTWYVKWPVRILAAAGIAAIGFIPYSYEIGGKCRLVPVAQHGVRAQIADEIVKVNVREGDWVESGAVIATLAARNETANVASTAAALERARADLALLRAGSRPEDIRMAKQEVDLREVQMQYQERELRRKKELMATAGTETQAELERVQSARDQSEQLLLTARENFSKLQQGARNEELRAAEAEVARLEADLDHHRKLLGLKDITAPIAGRIITLGVQQRLGQYVQPGDLVAVLQDTSHLRVAVQADQAAAVQIKPGQTVKLRLEGLDGRLLLGKVHEVSAGAMPESELDIEPVRSDRESHLTELYTRKEDRFVDVEVELDGGQTELIPGMTGYARIVISPDVLWRAVARPIVRFFMVEVWSWLP